jgi:hypothetical protein
MCDATRAVETLLAPFASSADDVSNPVDPRSLELSLALTALVERGKSWLSAHGAADPRVVVSRDALSRSTSLLLSAANGKRRKREPHGRAELALSLDAQDAVTSASCVCRVDGTRRALRHAARELERSKARPSVRVAAHPNAGKHDPADLEVTLRLDPQKPIEDLVSAAMRLLDDVVTEAAAHAR